MDERLSRHARALEPLGRQEAAAYVLWFDTDNLVNSQAVIERHRHQQAILLARPSSFLEQLEQIPAG